MSLTDKKLESYLVLAEEEEIIYKEGFKYQLPEDCAIVLSFAPPKNIEEDYVLFYKLKPKKGLLILKKGYAWDGCSGPTWDDATNMRAGAVHDAGYQLIRRGRLPMSYRALFDKEFRKICIKDGMSKLRAWGYYQGVHHFAEFAAEARSSRRNIRAPRKKR